MNRDSVASAPESAQEGHSANAAVQDESPADASVEDRGNHQVESGH